LFFLLHSSCRPRALPSFPTRRSSDLVICEMMGVPDEDRRGLYELSNRLIGFEDPEFQGSLDDGIQASIEMFLYASKLSERAKRRSEEHTSELQSRFDLVCRLLLEKKK